MGFVHLAKNGSKRTGLKSPTHQKAPEPLLHPIELTGLRHQMTPFEMDDQLEKWLIFRQLTNKYCHKIVAKK